MPSSPHRQKALVSSLLLACASTAGATTVTYQAPAAISTSFNSYNYSFEPMEFQDVDELISVTNVGNNAIINGNEGGTVTIAVDFVGNTSQTIATGISYSDFSNLTNLSFTEGTVDGLTFTYSGGGNGFVRFAKDTDFNFNQVPAPAPVGVPEPVEDALLLSGGAALWQRLRRRKGADSGADQADTSQTNSAYLPPAPREIGST